MRADHRGMPRRSLTAVAVALALTAPAAPAFADTVTVGIGRATTFDHQRGAFQVSAWTDAPDSTVTSVSAKIRKGDQVLVELPALTASNAAGYYQLPAETPLKLTEDGGQIPDLGRYSIDVTAEDSKGNKLTRLDAGTLDFTLRPEATFTLASPEWTDPVARPKGTLTGVQPGSGDTVPLTGRTVQVSRSYPEASAPQTVAVAADGSFAAEPYRVTTNTNWYDLAFSENSDQVHGSLKQQNAFHSVTARPVTVTGTADKTRVLPGEPFAISGRVVATDGGTPLAGTEVRVNSGGMVRLATTDGDGRYTALFKGAPGQYAGSWYVSPTDVFLNGGASGQVAMPAESHIRNVRGSLAADTTVTVTGMLEYTYESQGLHTEPMRLEHSADGRTGWKVIGTSETHSGYGFTVTGRSTGGWFRVHHPATDTMAESFGPVFGLSRTQTRVVSVNAAPEPVRKGAAVTVTGGLQQYKNGAWTLFAGQPVGLWFQAKGTSTYKLVASGKSAANGGVSLRTTATVDGTYLIRYLGTSTGTHFNSSAVGDFVDVL
ncbi:hypothetical protein ACGFMM_08650 [Streptomyces sp. NPDC048604]|uniref:hypothetical protein n=1 Tax=Streptomyces sp. NPDC048604 TaxID=3365578 RepID=UPI003711F58F